MIERWSRDQVLALAPDASSQKAAQGVAAPGKWTLRGMTDDVLFGACKGSGATPYMACVDLSEPAYRCSCPSRKFPCKHALGLLLMWSADGVPAADALPPWAAEWVAQRTERAAKAAAKLEAARARAAAEAAGDPELADGQAWDSAPDAGLGSGADLGSGTASGSDSGGGPGLGSGAGAASGLGEGSASGGGSGGGVGVAAGGGSGLGASATGTSGGGRGAGAESVRHARVAAGLAELERWLADQVRQGLAGTDADEWDELAKRLVDAQAPGVANALSRLREVRMADDWPSRLLAEYSLINLLAVAYRRRAELPGPLRQTVLIRAGFPVAREDVLARPVVRDRWHVVGRRDEEHDRLIARRVWLRGHDTGRAALVLSFAASGQPLDASLVTGTTIDADVAFYPGAAPLRALVATRHPTPRGVPADRSALTGQSDATDPRVLAGQREAAGRGDFGGRVPPGVSPEEALGEIAAAVAADPWTDSWPVVLAGVVPGRTSVGGFPLHPRSRDPWRLIAVSGGRPVTVAAEWTPLGLRPLTTWADDGTAVIL
ncbi:SWIM zinc finger family protein [Nonomuraea sp. NEAU-A123]|uniref:SWIM zinc finger family protein n=1 Tax=Nonomuraea sp. NEAU-A123 TaxID=2839649 RepID=UPI0027DF185A|nr:SWIM zinc finger family protein [Nonomuraea sp. NEAU-A123]